MARILAAVLVALVLAGCASGASGVTSGPDPAPGNSPASYLSGRPGTFVTPHAVTGTSRVGAARIRDLASAQPRVEGINCAGTAAREVVRVSPSPATSHVRICLAVGDRLVIRVRGVRAYRWSRPRLIGDPRVLRGAALRSYRAAAPGTVRVVAVGSPPNRTMGAVFQWFAWVVVR